MKSQIDLFPNWGLNGPAITRGLDNSLRDLYVLKDRVFNDGGYGEEAAQTLSAAIDFLETLPLGYSGRVLAAKVGVSDSVVSNIRAGGRAKLDNFLKLLGALISLYEEAKVRLPGGAPSFSGHAAEWGDLPSSIASKVAKITLDLNELLNALRKANSFLIDEAALAPELKVQIIAVLESLLSQLKTNKVEKGFLKKAGKWLLSIGKKAAESEIDSGISKLAENAGGDLLDVIKDVVL